MTTPRIVTTMELVGGSLCLDFTNTVNTWFEAFRDYIESYDDLLAWAERVGAISPADRARLAARAVADPAAAEAALKAARDRRAVICHVLGGASDGAVPPDELATLMDAHAGALAAATFEPGPAGFRPAWRHADDLASPLLPITHDAGALLLSPDVSRVRTCPSCGWLFLDRSRNGRRRWCSMDTCGSRSKMRRYRQARRARISDADQSIGGEGAAFVSDPGAKPA